MPTTTRQAMARTRRTRPTTPPNVARRTRQCIVNSRSTNARKTRDTKTWINRRLDAEAWINRAATTNFSDDQT
jgi:hypothetical protein